MKKIFFSATLLALVAGCAQDELENFPVQNNAEGITFEAVNPETRIQWEDSETSYVPFWYAEKDRVGIYAGNVQKGAFGGTSPVAGDGYDDVDVTTSGVSEYKATKSERRAMFTSVDDANLLHFDGKKVGTFVAVYPKPATNGANAAGKLKFDVPNMVAQSQEGLKGANPAQMMYALAKQAKVEDHDAVGEKIQLEFKRPLRALVFSTKNADAYTKEGATSTFGQLKTITVTTKGYDKNPKDGALSEANGDILETTLAYTNAHLEIDTITGKATVKKDLVDGTSGAASKTITLNLSQDWNDKGLAIAAILEQNRAKFASQDEDWDIVYSFDKIDLHHKDFAKIPAGTKFTAYMPVPALDVNNFPYLVTKGESGSTRTLIVNSGKFAEIFNAAGTHVKWADTESFDNTPVNNEIPVTEFETVIVGENVILNDAELALLNKMTGVKNLTLKGNTVISGLAGMNALVNVTLPEVVEVKANTFGTTNASTIAKLFLPKATKISAKAAGTSNTFTALTDLDVNSYAFAENDVYKLFFHTPAKTTLVNLKAEAIESFRPTFGYDRALSFEDYTVLETVALNPKGVALTTAAFKGCTALKKVTGIVDIANAPGAFDGAASGTGTLSTVNVANTIIPNEAFANGCKVKNVLFEGKPIVPTEIGEKAFFANTAVSLMDLSQATKIGASAFEGATAFEGTGAENNNVVTVAAKTINDKILNNTKVVRVQFTEATKLGKNILASSALKQIKFLKNIKAGDVDDVNTFADVTSANLDLFVATTQEGVNGLNCFGKTWKSVTREDTVFTK